MSDIAITEDLFELMLRNLAPETMETEERECRCGSIFTVDRLHGGTREVCPQCSAENKRQYVINHYKKERVRKVVNPVVVVGYVPIDGIPLEDYQDYWTGQEFTFDEVKYMIYNGSFTPGIVLQRQGTPRVIVVGEDENQELRVL